MTWQAAARDLSKTLALAHAPIGLSRMDAAPAGVTRYGKELPSACAFWRVAEKHPVYVTAEDHRNCPIGLMAMGFEPTPEIGARANALVGQMAELGYLDPAEVAHLPMLPRGHKGLLYGPAAEFETRPEVVLLIVTLAQAMVISEGIGRAVLTPGHARGAYGRPACSVIPRALAAAATEMSLACKGARVLAELEEGEMLIAIPGAEIEKSAESVTRAARANEAMESYYRDHRSKFAAA